MERGYETPPWEQLRPDDLPPELIEEARKAWASRTLAEYRSMIVFGEIIARFPEIGLPLEITSAASRLLSDEARHTELCARLTDKLGGHQGFQLDPKDLSLNTKNLPAHLFVARWTASMFCVGETASVGALQVFLENTKNPCVATILKILLRDEILHDQFGWALARTILPHLTTDEQDWLAADLAFVFAHYDRAHGAQEKTTPNTRLNDLGLGSPQKRNEAFQNKINTLILPSFAKLGIPAYEAWQLRTETGE
jgi:hypothetical protein